MIKLSRKAPTFAACLSFDISVDRNCLQNYQVLYLLFWHKLNKGASKQTFWALFYTQNNDFVATNGMIRSESVT